MRSNAPMHGGPIDLELIRGCCGDRSMQIEGQIDPRGLTGHRREILRRQIAAAGPKPLIVGDDELAMISQIARTDASQAEEWAKHRNLRTGSAQFIKVAPWQPDR